MISKENRKHQYLWYMDKVIVKGKYYRQAARLHNDYKDGYIFLVEAERFAEYETLRIWKHNGMISKMPPVEKKNFLRVLKHVFLSILLMKLNLQIA